MAMECQTHKPAWLPEEQGGYLRCPAELTGALVDHLFRHEAGKIVSVLTRLFGPAKLDLAGDGTISGGCLRGLTQNFINNSMNCITRVWGKCIAL